MTDSASHPDSEGEPASNADAESPVDDHGDTAIAGKPEKKKPKLPLGKPVFGKFCWLVAVVPYVIYLGGLGFAGWLESGRAHTCIDRQVHRVIEVFLTPAGNQLVAESGQSFLQPDGRTDLASRKAFLNQKFSEIGLGDFDKNAGVWAEFKTKEVREMIAPLMNGPPPDESRPWFPALYEQVKEPAEFLDKLLAYEEEHKLRPVLLDYYERFPEEDQTPAGVNPDTQWFPRDRSWYPTTYTIVIGLTLLSVIVVFPLYFRAPFSVSWLSVVVGVAGIVVWIGLWWLDKNVLGLAAMMGSGAREAFNPLEELASTPDWKNQFMVIRFFGLVCVVPIIEEFFLRGFLMRYIEHPDWDRIPLGFATKLSIIGVAIYAVFSHTFEPLAAIVWFSMVTWLYLKTKSIWDCVVAHSITNLLLGIYVVMTGTWALW